MTQLKNRCTYLRLFENKCPGNKKENIACMQTREYLGHGRMPARTRACPRAGVLGGCTSSDLPTPEEATTLTAFARWWDIRYIYRERETYLCTYIYRERERKIRLLKILVASVCRDESLIRRSIMPMTPLESWGYAYRIYIYIHIYIYIEREREIIYVYVYIHACIQRKIG